MVSASHGKRSYQDIGVSLVPERARVLVGVYSPFVCPRRLYCSTVLFVASVRLQDRTTVIILRQYYPRKLLGPLKSGMGRGLRPPRSVASVERTPAARPLLSIGRASGSTSGSALELVYAGGGGRPKLLSPCHVTSGLTISSLIYREQTGPVPFFASLNRLSSPLSYRPAGL